MSLGPEEQGPINKSVSGDLEQDTSAAQSVRQEFIDNEGALTQRVIDFIEKVGVEVTTAYSVTSRILDFPPETDTVQDLYKYGVRFVQDFMPDDPLHIRRSALVYVEYNEADPASERMVGRRTSFDFCTNGALLQTPYVHQALESMDNEHAFAKQSSFRADLERIAAITAIDTAVS